MPRLKTPPALALAIFVSGCATPPPSSSPISPSVCPPLRPVTMAERETLAAALEAAQAHNPAQHLALDAAMRDYARMRDDARACRTALRRWSQER